ncbi:MAG: hypothetical protein Q9197_006245 [Variospora fuerteventurae]
MAGFIIHHLLLSFAAGSARAGTSRPTSPLVVGFDNVRPCSRASRPSQWIAESRSLASRASRRASSATRPSTSRRPTIGVPSDFRRVDQISGSEPNFRPLQLSIYLPGNELPTLPSFREEEEEVEEDNARLTYPAQALVKSRSDSMLSRPSTAFSIPRKPVPNRTASMDQSRSSLDTRYTSNDTSSGLEPRSTYRRPSLVTARQSTQDFLDALDTRLPQAPPALRSKSGPEPVYTLYRRASEQSLRLRTHLEERSQIERRLPEFGIIPEERQGSTKTSTGLSPILDRDEITPADDLLGNRACGHTRSDSAQSLALGRFHLHSSVATPVPAPTKPSRRSVVSQWLLRSVGSQVALRSDCDCIAHDSTGDCIGHHPCTFRDRSSTTSSTIYSSSTAPDLASSAITPYSSPHKKTDSVSTYHTVSIPRMSYDWEKRPVLVDVKPKPVGMHGVLNSSSVTVDSTRSRTPICTSSLLGLDLPILLDVDVLIRLEGMGTIGRKLGPFNRMTRFARGKPRTPLTPTMPSTEIDKDNSDCAFRFWKKFFVVGCD